MNQVSRGEAVAAIRGKLLTMADEDHSLCQIASEKGIFCRGFDRYDDQELRRRYDWLVKHDPSMSREQLEQMANRWQLARQMVDKVSTSCDAQCRERDTCAGWDDFDNRMLARFYRELVGVDVEVTG